MLGIVALEEAVKPKGVMQRTGFTLIELVVSLAILALLATMAFPMGEVIVQRNKEQELRKSLRQIRDAIDAYKQFYDDGHIVKKIEVSGYPPSLADLEAGVQDAKRPDEKKVYFLRRVPRDPFAPEDIPAIDTWGVRSYDSSISNPHNGNDVFDVYSQAQGNGLNGVPYQEW
jgi:general secretion pathway protein G